MAKVTMTITMDTENAGDLSILQIVKGIASGVKIDIQPVGAASTAQPAAKPTGPKAVPDAKPEAKKTPAPKAKPTGKPPEKMDYDELAAWIPLQREVTMDMARLIGKANKIKHSSVDVIGQALDKVNASNFKEVKDYKAFVMALIEVDGSDVGI